MPQPTPPPLDPEPPPKPVPTPETPPPGPDAAASQPADEGAVFHALLDAGVEARLAYTAEKKMRAMTSDTVAAHTRPILAEVRDLGAQGRDLAGEVRELAAQGRDLASEVRQLAAEVRDLAAQVRDLARAGAERDRRLDVIVARLDGLKLLGQIMIGAYVLLITVLIAVFGLLFTNAN